MVLLDLKLPKVNGLQVLQELKSDDRTKAIPVIVLTTSKEERDLISSYKCGVNSYIQKPVSFSDFQDVVRQLGMYWLLVNSKAPAAAFTAAAASGTNEAMNAPRKVPELTGPAEETPLRLLIVDDDANDLELCLRGLRKSGIAMDVVCALTREEFNASCARKYSISCWRITG